jgi:hypothetical protein
VRDLRMVDCSRAGSSLLRCGTWAPTLPGWGVGWHMAHMEAASLRCCGAHVCLFVKGWRSTCDVTQIVSTAVNCFASMCPDQHHGSVTQVFRTDGLH